jgi:hypothetical protein
MGFFSDLQHEQAKQKEMITPSSTGEVIYPTTTEDAQVPAQNSEPESAHEVAHEPEQVLTLPEDLPTTDVVEMLTFSTRRDTKVKVNTEVPEIWKTKLDDIAHQLKVGKYELLAYIIGDFLDEV